MSHQNTSAGTADARCRRATVWASSMPVMPTYMGLRVNWLGPSTTRDVASPALWGVDGGPAAEEASQTARQQPCGDPEDREANSQGSRRRTPAPGDDGLRQSRRSQQDRRRHPRAAVGLLLFPGLGVFRPGVAVLASVHG